MLASLRSSASIALRCGSSTGASARVAAAAVSRRTLVTKEERWTPETARQAAQSNLIPDASGKGGADLSVVVPNIEARWAKMSKEEQYGVFRQLEELQRKDWKELSLDEKKAAYFVSFGPHGPRKATTQPGQGLRSAIGVLTIVGATFGLFFGLRNFAHGPPRTMTTEYQEQATERAREEKQNPISGIASEGYQGKGHVQKSYT